MTAIVNGGGGWLGACVLGLLIGAGLYLATDAVALVIRRRTKRTAR